MSKRTLYAFIISFLLLVAVIVLNRYTFNKMREFTGWVVHTQDVITRFERLASHLKSAQIYSPNIYDTIPEREFYVLYKNETDSVDFDLSELHRLVQDNSRQDHLLDTLMSQIAAQMPTLRQKNIVEMINSGEAWRLHHLNIINESINRGIKYEKEKLSERTRELESFTSWNNLLSVSFAVIGIGILLFTFFYNLFITRKSLWLEGFLESILNTSQNGVTHYKAIRKNGAIVDFTLEFTNLAVGRLLQVAPEELIGKKLSEIPYRTSITDLFDHFVRVVETGKPAEFETKATNEGIELWFLVSLVKLDDGVVASFNNITQLKQYEAELKVKIEDLERSNTELEQYAYVASHDLQEPLRKIRSFGSYLQDTQAHQMDEKGKQQLGKIMSAAERMSVLIKDILSYSSLKKEDVFVKTDLNETLANVQQDLDLLITQKHAEIRCEPLPVIQAIPLQMHQLFYNLITNSLKFSKENQQPVITITCRKLPAGERPSQVKSECYEIVISDNGIGFSQDYAEQIFGLFKRLNDKNFYPGSGIGLALCKKVVDNHHGTIEAKGSEGTGASFIIRLPEQQ